MTMTAKLGRRQRPNTVDQQRALNRFLDDVERLATAASDTIDVLHTHGLERLARPLERALERISAS